jgi:hypothetical protein
MGQERVHVQWARSPPEQPGGAMFVFDKKENLTIVNGNFNDRGNTDPRAFDDQFPLAIVDALSLPPYLFVICPFMR